VFSFWKNLFKSFLAIFLVVGIIYAATNNYHKDSWQSLDVITWNNLWTEVTALRAELDSVKTELAAKADKTYVDTEVSNVEATLTDWIVASKWNIDASGTNWRTWTISNVVVNKPLYITLDWTGWKWSIVHYYVQDGSLTWITAWDTQFFMLAANSNEYSTSSSTVIIPNKTTVKIRLKSYTTTNYGWTLHAYQ